VVLDNFKTIEPAVSGVLKNGELSHMKAKAAALENRAVFEIPEILAKISEA
jgi:hypothetical protein